VRNQGEWIDRTSKVVAPQRIRYLLASPSGSGDSDVQMVVTGVTKGHARSEPHARIGIGQTIEVKPLSAHGWTG
jgi:hypothetical protein